MNNPKYRKRQTVNTPYGVGEIKDFYAHALDPDSEPNMWVYHIKLNKSNGLKIAAFQESEINTETK